MFFEALAIGQTGSWMMGTLALAALVVETADLLEAVRLGLLAGVIVGAVAWPITREPETGGRALALAVIFGIIVIVFEVGRIAVLTGSTLGTIINAFQGETSRAIGAIVLQGGIRVLIAMLLGALVGVGSLTPGRVVLGALVGTAVGAVIAIGLTYVLDYFGVGLSAILFQILVGLGTWGLFVSLGGE